MSGDALILRPLDIQRDAAQVARMWNESDLQWPGTFCGGAPRTAEGVRDWLEREDDWELLVWEARDAPGQSESHSIAGYGAMWLEAGEPNVAYVALLNVAPNYQGRSLCRTLLARFVNRAIDAGLDRLYLRTWPGNVKAVPLYKKCGFVWEPDSSVLMPNYLPAIFRLPPARAFFDGRDWYRCLERELRQEEDDERWEGMKAYAYRFADNGHALSVWIDRESGAPLALETGAYFAGLIAANPDPPRGLETAIRCRLRNKTAMPMRVALRAAGEGGIALEHRETLTLAAGEEREIEAVGRIAPRAEGKPKAVAELDIEGERFELAAGLRPCPPVEIRLEPEALSLAPGIEREARVWWRNQTGSPIEVSLALAAPEGLRAEWSLPPLALAAGERGEARVALLAEREGIFDVSCQAKVEFGGKTIQPPMAMWKAFAPRRGGVLAVCEKGRVRMENERIRAWLKEKGATLAIEDAASGESLAVSSAAIGPPSQPNEWRALTFQLACQTRDGQAAAEAWAESKRHPGLIFRRRIVLGADSIVRIEHIVENRSAAPVRAKIEQTLQTERQNAILTAPLRSGIVQGPAANFPGAPDDEFQRPDNFAESWIALECPRGVVGSVWSGAAEAVWLNGNMPWRSQAAECPPGAAIGLAPFALVFGDGDWRAVRRAWRRIAGVLDESGGEERAAPALEAFGAPAPLATAGSSAGATLHVAHRIPRPAAGAVELRLPDGWSSDRSRFEFAGVNWSGEKRKSIRLSAPPEAGAARAVVAWESDEGDGECVWPLIRLGDGRSVETAELERHGRRLLALDNGILRLELAPGYGGAAPGLFKGKTNRLQSPFPAIGAIDRIAPFHGGILPFLEALRGPLRRETFEGEFPADEEANGFLWRGVRERVAICNDERLCGLILEYGFWTVGGAKTIRLGVRAINRTGVRQRPHVGFAVFARPGGTESDPILFAPGIRLKPGPLDRTAPEGEYAGALDPVSGKAIVLAGRLSAARIQRFGAQACALFYTERLNLNPGAAAEAIAYLSLAKNEEEALAYSALGQCMNRTDRRA